MRWFEPALHSILHREYNNYYMGDGAVIEQNDFLLLSLRSFLDKEICSCVISVTERNNVSISLLYMDVYVHLFALSLRALRLVQYEFAVSAI